MSNPDLDDRLIDEALARIPDRLCKYSGLSGNRLDYVHDAIVNTTVWAAQAKSFNDPLDSAMPPELEATEEQIRAKWTQFIQDQYLPDADPDVQRRKIELFVRRSQNPDTKEALKKVIVEALTSQYGLVSLTPCPDDILMWSYYAEKHSGLCLLYDSSPATVRRMPALSYPMAVDYLDEVPGLNYYTATDFQFIRALLGSKSSKWSHESEWRLLFAQHTGRVQLPEQMLAGIVFGLRTSEAYRLAVRCFNDRRKIPVPLFEITRAERSYDLRMEEL